MVPKPKEGVSLDARGSTGSDDADWDLWSREAGSNRGSDRRMGSMDCNFSDGAGTPRQAPNSEELEAGPDPAAASPAAGSGYDPGREELKAALAVVVVAVFFIAVFLVLSAASVGFEEPECPVRVQKSCKACGEGTSILPIFGEWEQAWPDEVRAPLYLVGLLWAFMGVGVVCDQFMTGIEEITSSKTTKWVELHAGCRQRLRTTIWNATTANLSLMALGSSAPEILLSATELQANKYFAGQLGPATIVGSAAFNLLMISAACIYAIPAPDIRRIEGVDVFIVTTTFSIVAYLWLLVILLASSPDKVDLWEGFATLAGFPLLLIMAFAADKGWISFQRSNRTQAELFEQRSKQVEERIGRALPPDTLKLLVEAELEAEKRPTASRAELRKATMSSITGRGRGSVESLLDRSDSRGLHGTSSHRGHGGTDLTFGFSEKRYMVLENVGVLYVKVIASRAPGAKVKLYYCTHPGTAKRDVRYSHVEGALEFGPRQREAEIGIPIIDNDSWDPDEVFYISLSKPADGMKREVSEQGSEKVSKGRSASKEVPPLEFGFGVEKASIMVLNDDMPGELTFDAEEVVSYEGTTVTLGVFRTGGTSGRIACQYDTKDDSAVEGTDYTGAHGTLTFEDGETHKTISIDILVSKDHEYEDDEWFSVELSNPSPGVVFKTNALGRESSACHVLIQSDSESTCLVLLARRFFNRDRMQLGMRQWREQVVSAFYCDGNPEDQAGAGATEWALHVLTLTWKLLFSLVPPPLFAGGWLCFIFALGMIGIMTAIVGELASLLGCTLGIGDEVTAITLVALGTSLPDTFASKAAALQDDSADNAIGNIMGSNSVNVFLGLGISWTAGAVYWEIEGITQEWKQRQHNGKTYEQLFLDGESHLYPGGGFIYPAGTLLFNVCVYLFCALLCIALLLYRRQRYGGELGGPLTAQIRDASLMTLLWFVYIAAVITQASI